MQENTLPTTNSFKEASWNLAAALTTEIQFSLIAASRYYMQGRTDKAFFALKTVKMRVEQYFNEQERKDFEKQEIIVHHLITERNKINKSWAVDEDLEKWTELDGQLRIEYEKYNTMLMDIMQKYALSIPSKEDEGLF